MYGGHQSQLWVDSIAFVGAATCWAAALVTPLLPMAASRIGLECQRRSLAELQIISEQMSEN
jgi:hypothetical protein